jgi:DNA-binding MarR family transcriptional regulator
MELQKEGLVETIPNFENRQFEYRLTKEGHRLAIALGLDRLAKALAKIKN